MERDAKIGQHAVNLVNSMKTEKIRDEPIIGMYKCKPGIDRSILKCVDVAIKTEEPARGAKPL